MFVFVLVDGLYGCFAGLVWAIALGLPVKGGLYYGLGVGVICGVSLFLINKFTKNNNRIHKEELSFVAVSQSVFILGAVITLALIAWLMRVIFG